MKTHTTLWCGVDVAKKSFDAALITNQGACELKRIPVKRFESSEAGVGEFVSWLECFSNANGISSEAARVVMESTGGYSLRLAKLLVARQAYLSPAIVNPAHAAYFQKSLGLQSKTDAIDARALGIFGRERKPPAYEFPSEMVRELRSLFRLRADLVSERVANENRLAECDGKLAAKYLKRHIASLEKRIKGVERDMAQITEKDEEIAASDTLLRSIPGVGPLTSACVLAELGDLKRFNSARQLTSFVGLSPKLKESGTSVRGQARLSRSGSPVVRRAMYMAALAAIRNRKTCFSAFFERLVANGKPRKSAILAVARKMLVVMRAIIKTNKPYAFPKEPVENHH